MEQFEPDIETCSHVDTSPLATIKRKYLNRFPNIDTLRKVLACEDEGEQSRALAATRFDPEKMRELIQLYKAKCEAAGKRVPITIFSSSQDALNVFGFETTPCTVKHKKRPKGAGISAEDCSILGSESTVEGDFQCC